MILNKKIIWLTALLAVASMQAGSLYKFRNIGSNPIKLAVSYSAIDTGVAYERQFILRENSDFSIAAPINCCLNCVTGEINDIETELLSSWKTCSLESKSASEECILNAELDVAAISGSCGIIWVNLAARIKVMEDLMRWARGMFPGLPDKPYVKLGYPERAAYAQIPNLRDYMGHEVMKYEQQWNESMASCGYPHYSQVFDKGVTADDINKLSKFWAQGNSASLLVKLNTEITTQTEPAPAPPAVAAPAPIPTPVVAEETQQKDVSATQKTKKRKKKKRAKGTKKAKKPTQKKKATKYKKRKTKKSQ